MNYTIEKIITYESTRQTFLIKLDNNERYIFKYGNFDSSALKLISEHDLPHVARILNVTDKSMLTEFVNGNSLDKMFIQASDVYTILLQLCDALSSLHRIGVLYLDMKPDNIVLDDHGNATLIDFENAIITSNIYRRLPFLGCTAYFSSPELQNVEDATERSDIYSLGMTIRAILNDNISPSLKAIVERCTALRPEMRYASVDELKKDILKTAKM